MALEAHLSELVERHRALDDRLEREMAHPQADDQKIADLKKRKLFLKDQIARLQFQLVKVA